MCFIRSAAALTLPPSQRVVYLRLDNVCYIKHPLQVKVRDNIPPNSVHITIMHPFGRKLWPALEEKGFPPLLSPLAMSLFPAVLSCNSKGRKGGNSMKTKRWKA